MYNIVVNTVLKTAGLYILALILSRLMERKLISQMTFSDFVVGISMGSMVSNAAFNSGNMSLAATIALVAISTLSIITGYLHIKSFKVRKLVNSEPVTLIQNGNIIEQNMKNIRMTISELMMKLREKNAFSVADVEFAIMETDGQLSVLPKADKQPLTPKHMNIQTQSAGLTRDIIIDGVIMEENLTGTGLNREWLNSQLSNQNIKDASQVFYAGIDNTKKLFISRKSGDSSEAHGKYGIE